MGAAIMPFDLDEFVSRMRIGTAMTVRDVRMVGGRVEVLVDHPNVPDVGFDGPVVLRRAFEHWTVPLRVQLTQPEGK